MSDKRTGLVVLSDAVKSLRVDVQAFQTSSVPQTLLNDISTLQSEVSTLQGRNVTVPQSVFDDLSTLQASVSTLQGKETEVPQSVFDDISTLQANVTALQESPNILSFSQLFNPNSSTEDIHSAIDSGKICPFISPSDSFSYNIGLTGTPDLKIARILNANNPSTAPRSITFADADNTELVVLGAGESCRLIYSQILGRWVKVDGV